MKISPILIYRTLAILSCVGVVAAALLPDNDGQIHMTDIDKVDHIIAFGTLSVLAVLALPKTSSLWIGAALVMLGGAIELIQGLPIVHRDCSVWDWLADTVAIALGLALVKIHRMRQRRASNRS